MLTWRETCLQNLLWKGLPLAHEDPSLLDTVSCSTFDTTRNTEHKDPALFDEARNHAPYERYTLWTPYERYTLAETL